MSDTTNLAARLLAFAPSPEVADALAARATISDTPVRAGAALSPAIALSTARRGVHYAATVAAMDGLDPAVLAKLAKMPQKTVRRIVAANPETPYESLEELGRWALNTNGVPEGTGRDPQYDDDTIDALCGTLLPPQWLPQIADLRSHGFDPSAGRAAYGAKSLTVDPIVDQLARRGDAQLVWDTYHLGYQTLMRAIALAAAQGRLPVNVSDLVADGDWRTQRLVLHAITYGVDRPELTLDLAHQIIAAFDESTETLPEGYRKAFDNARSLNDYAVATFLDSGNPLLINWVARCFVVERATLNAEQIAFLVNRDSASVAEILLRDARGRSRLSAEQLAKVALLAHAGQDTAKRLLLDHGAYLPAAARVNLIRSSGEALLREWIVGKLGVAPTLEELEALAANPGSSVKGKLPEPTVGALVAAVDNMSGFTFTEEHGREPRLDVVFNHAGSTTLMNATNASGVPGSVKDVPNGFTTYLARRLNDRFGADARAWETATKMAPSFQVGTIDDFLTVVEAVAHTQ